MAGARKARKANVAFGTSKVPADEPPPLDVAESWTPELNNDDPELAEFREFFISTRPDLVALQPQRPANPRRAPRPRSRLATATAYIGHLAIIRPEIPLPWLRRLRSAAHGAERAYPLPTLRVKLPPIWALANFLIVATLLVAFAPQILLATAQAGCSWYTVRSGDTLVKVGARYGVSIGDIAAANHIQDPSLIYVDERLCIPMSAFATSLNASIGVVAHPPAPSVPTKVGAFIAFTLPYARQASEKTGWPVSMILAQWGLETSWRVQTFTGYNWGNCGAMPGEPAIPGTSAPGSPLQFAYAYTPKQGLEEYVHVAHLHYYTGIAVAARSGGANAAARALGASPWDWGHYTDRNSPGSSLIALMRMYNLYWYDTH